MNDDAMLVVRTVRVVIVLCDATEVIGSLGCRLR